MQRETLAKHPTPPTTPLEALAHVLAVYEDAADDMRVISATTNIYPGVPWTGLRLGDLRRVLDDHADYLAEKLTDDSWSRRDHWGRYEREEYEAGMRKAADLIAPEVKK
jgi:hypothetical protein